jgi:hypothetical protein
MSFVESHHILEQEPDRLFRWQKKGAVTSAHDWRGNTALQLATNGGHREIIDLLIDKPAILDAIDQLGRTLLHQTKLIVDRRPVVDAADNDGSTTRSRFSSTVLHLAPVRSFVHPKDGHRDCHPCLPPNLVSGTLRDLSSDAALAYYCTGSCHRGLLRTCFPEAH